MPYYVYYFMFNPKAQLIKKDKIEIKEIKVDKIIGNCATKHTSEGYVYKQ